VDLEGADVLGHLGGLLAPTMADETLSIRSTHARATEAGVYPASRQIAV
jgi:hypothetical protein